MNLKKTLILLLMFFLLTGISTSINSVWRWRLYGLIFGTDMETRYNSTYLDDLSINDFYANVNGAENISGKVDQALYFDGETDYVEVPHDDTLDFGTGDFSISLWVKKAFGNSENEAILNKINTGGVRDGYGLFLREGGLVWFQDDRSVDPIVSYNLLLYEGDLTDEPTNPTRIPDDEWEGSVLCEQNDFKIGSEYRSWYRGSSASIGYETSTDGISWVPYEGNPLSFPNSSGSLVFPYVVREDNNFYMFIKDVGDVKFYLYNVTEPTNPVLMNDGNPVLEESQDWEINLANVGVCIVNDTWHMLYEGGTGGAYNLGYTYSNLTEMNWTAHKSPNNPIINASANADLTYVPERNAILALHGYIQSPPCIVVASYAYLSNNLSLASSWHRGATLITSDVHDADPHMIVGFSDDYNIMISWNHNQEVTCQTYSTLSLPNFFDSITSPSIEKWHHFLVINNNGTLGLYIDDDLKVTGTWIANVSIPSQNLVLGRASHGSTTQFFEGIIDEVKIFNVALSRPTASWIDNTMLALGISGLILMVASPTWGAMAIRKKGLHPDSMERLYYAGFLFCVGFGLLIMWLWS